MMPRNAVPPHLVKKSCRKCKTPTPALHKGQIINSPTCAKCQAEEATIFRLAQLAANRQARNRAHQGQARNSAHRGQ